MLTSSLRPFPRTSPDTLSLCAREAGRHLEACLYGYQLAILDAMERAAVTTLPIHDSFIVKQGHRDTLERTMREVYWSRYQLHPELKATLPAISGPPRSP